MLGFLNRRSMLFAGLAAAISVPYAWNDPKVQQYVGDAKKILTPAGDAAASTLASGQLAGNGLPNSTAPPALESLPDVEKLPVAIEGPPINDFGEVIRFDVDPRWVTQRWSRVTTILAEYSLEGLRVPLVTGTKLDDIAGAITYYYDQTHQLQRITLHGYTGDERRLVQFVQQAFALEPEPSLYAGLYMTRWNGKPKSALLVRMAPIVVSSAPHNRIEVLLEINRPNYYYDLSAEFRQLLNHGRKNTRWGN